MLQEDFHPALPLYWKAMELALPGMVQVALAFLYLRHDECTTVSFAMLFLPEAPEEHRTLWTTTVKSVFLEK